ncbi:MAG: hypothetical protein IKF80_06525 [Erysipelotrichaceae bacterium]|nr:hypothetical protein [Erysipelotrichaceae bacterium]
MKKLLTTILILSLFLLSGCDTESKIERQIKKMSLKDKVSQMIMPCLRYSYFEKTVDENGNEKTIREPLEELDERYTSLLNEYKFGGIILFEENLRESEKSFNLIRQIKQAHGEDEIPLLISADQEGGYIRRIVFGTSMSGNMALCASNDPSNAYDSANIIGSELKLLGINTNFAPVVDVNSNPNNPVIGVRSFSDDSEYAKEYIEKCIEGYHSQNILTALKHYPGHGDTAEDSHTGLPQVNKTYEEIKEKELKTFEYGIAAGADMIMSAHIMFPNIDNSQYIALNGQKVYLPATLSKKIISILREDMAYDGIIITDSLTMDAIRKYYKVEDTARFAINAGVDMLLMPIYYHEDVETYIKELKEYTDMIVKMVENGEIEESTIDDAVRRILRVKYKNKLDNRTNEIEELSALIGSKESHDKELEIAKKTITMIENAGVNLPLNKDKKTLFLAPYKSQGNAIDYAGRLLKEEGLADKENFAYYVFGSDDAKTFDYKMIDDYDNVAVISAMYGFEDICDEYSTIIEKVLELCKENGKTSILISSQLPYDLSRFEADIKMATYLASGVSEIPSDYSRDVVTYSPNLIACVMHLYESGIYDGKLPVNVPKLAYDEEEKTYFALDEIRYQRGFGLTE